MVGVLSVFSFACLAAMPLAAGVTLPAGTELEVRLQTKVSSDASKPNDPVQAVLIRPVVSAGKIALPAGTLLNGIVEKSAAAKADERALLHLAFTTVAGSALEGKKIEARVTRIDNAREAVDEKGAIRGILASETLSSQMQSAIDKLSARSSAFGSVLEAARAAMFKDPVPDIIYEPGVELHVELSKPLEIDGAPPAGAGPGAIPSPEELFRFVNAQPFQTTAEDPPLPSDITNLMFIGTEQQLADTFTAAGWDTAASLSTASKLEVIRAVVEGRGYKEAPMSILLLERGKPDLVFQKQNNTFAKRHHLRIWRRPAAFLDRPVWVCAATHDIGIEFSPENRTFIHRIDSRIDSERAKVVNDLLFTGRVKALSLVDRPRVPTQTQNATGDKIETDGRMAVLLLD